MSNFSIKSASISKKESSSNIGNSEFFKLKKEYEKQKRKMQKTDFANSPVALEKELTLLAKLKELAEKEGLLSEVKNIEDREQSIYTKLANTPVTSNGELYYSPLTFKGGSSSIRKEKLSTDEETSGLDNIFYSQTEQMSDEFLEGFKSQHNDIPLDDNSEEIIRVLGKKNYGMSNTAYIVKKCIGDDGHTSLDKLCAVKLFADADMSSAIIPQLLEELVVSDDESSPEKIDIDACKKVCDFKHMGFEDIDSLHFTRYLNSNFENKETVVKNIIRLNKSGIGSDATLKILDSLRTYDSETGKDNISNSSIQSVLRIKKALLLARNNEKSERDNPINLLGVQKFSFGDDVMIVKDGKITYITPVEGESVYNLQQQYDEMVSKIEDNLLIDFVKKYKDENGEIDSKYVRTLIALRHYGVTYGQLLNMVDMCINKDGNIDKNTLEVIKELKSSGVLSDDIPLIMTAITKDNDGLYNKDDISNASMLTSRVTPGHVIATLLPDMNKNENLKDFVLDFSSVIEDKKYLIDLVNLVKDDKGNIDENAMDVIYNLAQNILRDDNPINMSDFLKYANNIIQAAINSGENKVNDEGAGIVAIMCQNFKSPEDIISALDACHDSKGNIDEKLSEVIWMMSLQKSDIDQMLDIIDACKREGYINYNLVDTIISFFNSGLPVEKILEFALG